MKLTRKLLAASVAVGTLFSASQSMAFKIGNVSTPDIGNISGSAIHDNSTGGAHYNLGNKKFAIGSYVYEGGRNFSTSGYFYIGRGSFYAAGDITNQHSTVVTEQVTVRAAVESQLAMINDHLDSVSATQIAPTGGNGGAHGKRFSLLGRFNWTNLKEDTKDAAWKANQYAFALGFDYKINDMFTAGLALTYSYLDGDTSFNRGTIRDHAYGVVPFLRVKPLKWLALDLMGGYSHVEKKRTRTTLFYDRADKSGVNVEGKPNADRWFGAVFATLTHSINKLNLLARAGYVHTEDKQKTFAENNGDRYTAQTMKSDSGHLRLQAGYSITKMFEPFAFGTYEYYRDSSVDLGVAEVFQGGNVQRNPDINSKRAKNIYGGGLGLNIRATNNVSGGIEYGYKQGKDLKVHNVKLKVKYEF